MTKAAAAGRDAPDRPVGDAGQDESARKNMLLLIQLRWIAVAGQIATVLVTHLGFGVALPLGPMAVVLAALVGLNLASLAWLGRGHGATQLGLLLALVLDVAALTAQLYLSGGATNPFTSLFLLQVTLAAVLLDRRAAWGVVMAAVVAVTILAVRSRPLELPPDGPDLFRLYLLGMMVGLVLNAGLIVVFVARVSRNLRERDARLAAMRQREAEEDHVVRMGLLASGAAHELGTPLSSVSVILGDWRRVPGLVRDPEIAREIDEMQAAVSRCKAIVTGILLAAGAARGESPHVTSVRGFVEDLVAEWRAMRACPTLAVRDRFGPDRPIVSDTALKQVVFNVLDNALEVSPAEVEIDLARDGDDLTLSVSDRGPGFAPDMLAGLGRPYRSSKGRLGGGLGLFLVVNVVRKLGGSVTARNREGGGATVTLALPLAALSV